MMAAIVLEVRALVEGILQGLLHALCMVFGAFLFS